MNNTTSKEEMYVKQFVQEGLNRKGCVFELGGRIVGNITGSDICDLIIEYAKQEAIGFSNFCSERYHGIRGDKGWMMVESPFTKYTDDEAYDLYLLHKQNKEQ